MTGARQVAIVGGGIVGLASAWALAEAMDPHALVILEKEERVGQHQSGRNSNVLHSGIYYQPGSLKARFCRQGKRRMEAFCEAEGLPLCRTGKLILARSAEEEPRLRELYDRGKSNGVDCRPLTAEEVRKLEPRAKATAGLEVPETAVVDFGQVTARLAEKLAASGAEVLTGRRVQDLTEEADGVRLTTDGGDIFADFAVNCGGLHSDRLVRALGEEPAARIIPFRGEYYQLRGPAAEGLSGRCLYPIADPSLPFLGVHVTPTVEGRVLCGPNAVLALRREGYGWRQVDLGELWRMATHRGFQRLAMRYWRVGLSEILRSLSRRRFAAAVNGLVEGVAPEDLEPWPAGVRAQAVSPDGQLVDDFLIVETSRTWHVVNAPSPAATASLRIGQEIAQRLETRALDQRM